MPKALTVEERRRLAVRRHEGTVRISHAPKTRTTRGSRTWLKWLASAAFVALLVAAGYVGLGAVEIHRPTLSDLLLPRR